MCVCVQSITNYVFLYFSERQEKISLQLKNAEISQSHENIKIQLRDEQEEANELTDRLKSMEIELEKRIVDIAEMNIKLTELNDAYKFSTELQTQIDRQNMEATEKNKVSLRYLLRN